MAIAAKALASGARDPHRKRVLARYAFVYIDDVIKFGATWRNQIRRGPATRPAADSALPALSRLRTDWKQYEDVRNYIAAKRQPRDPSNPLANELESFALWTSIGSLSVGALVDDSAELYAQLSSVASLPPVDFDPTWSNGLQLALDGLDGFGEEGSVELAASTFGRDRPGAFPIRMGGKVGRLVPLMNDVAENLQTLQKLYPATSGHPAIEQLVTCQLPTELYELLRLAIGPEAGAAPSSQASLLDLYSEPGMPVKPRQRLEAFRDWIEKSINRAELRDWRNRIGAHIDEDSPWSELAVGLSTIDLPPISRIGYITLEQLECCALEPQGPITLLFPSRKLRSLALVQPRPALSYDDPDASSLSTPLLPPPGFEEAHHMVWTASGSNMTAAIAGIHASRAAELKGRIAGREERERHSQDATSSD